MREILPGQNILSKVREKSKTLFFSALRILYCQEKSLRFSVVIAKTSSNIEKLMNRILLFRPFTSKTNREFNQSIMILITKYSGVGIFQNYVNQ